MNLSIDAQRLHEELAQMAAISGAAGPDVRQDAVGNAFARRVGSQPELAAVAVSGPGGLEAIRALRDAGHRPRRSVELIRFTAAAGAARFGIGCLGSRLLSGAMPAWKAARLSGEDGKTFDEWRAEAGFEGPLESAALAPGHYAAFLELQIEPGGPPLRIVTSFAASAGLRVTVEGEGAEDALGEIAQEVRNASMGAGAVDCVASGVTSRFRLEINVADPGQAKRDQMVSQIACACRDTAQRRRIAVKAEVLHMDPAVECGAEVVDALARAAGKHSLGYQRMASRGCHHAQFLSRIAPAGTLLVPSPAEAASGALVLAEALAELAG
jgi:N-carbamoyl-L-amino-acid hydrolase